MDAAYLEGLLKEGSPTVNPEAYWDTKAEDFYLSQRAFESSGPPKPLTLLQDKGIFRKEGTALDIGCGAGRYSLHLAQMFGHVTLTDISEKMLNYAKMSLEEQSVRNANYVKLDWESADLAGIGWENKFDFVFASMCPAIRSRKGLEKMSQASRYACAVTQFVQIEDSLSEVIIQSAGIEKSKLPGNNRDAAYALFSLVWMMGYLPEIAYIQDKSQREVTVEQALQSHSPRLAGAVRAQGMDMAEIIASAATNGELTIANNSTLAVIYWKK
ncbi:class I SAM-dependent methyltransferase [Desulfitobacterium chlororespirans]|uniref:Methyltransferase domain-containing protein n=1 Tax=Desulfitobacterium chlororespirans DSM 11544 TaxID=1121395 RepID=A0A1M7URT1_9FIRM|nr:class I SAM-dependent methyltransferase [Desulfitobacterium chlororespirans]SHN85635.1 Methyltransferase domain-containing protein [Desulfitobacterium chlororespirans DSM 11544]